MLIYEFQGVVCVDGLVLRTELMPLLNYAGV